MKLFVIFVLIVCAVVIVGLIRGGLLTWGQYTDEELEEMGVKPGRKNERE